VEEQYNRRSVNVSIRIGRCEEEEEEEEEGLVLPNEQFL